MPRNPFKPPTPRKTIVSSHPKTVNNRKLIANQSGIQLARFRAQTAYRTAKCRKLKALRASQRWARLTESERSKAEEELFAALKSNYDKKRKVHEMEWREKVESGEVFEPMVDIEVEEREDEEEDEEMEGEEEEREEEEREEEEREEWETEGEKEEKEERETESEWITEDDEEAPPSERMNKGAEKNAEAVAASIARELSFIWWGLNCIVCQVLYPPYLELPEHKACCSIYC
jgi:hypothetical protein